jgi:hypothetical protein
MEVGMTCCSFEMHGPSNCSVYEVCRMNEFINIAEDIMWFMFCLFETAVSRLQLHSGRRIWKSNSGYTHPYFWQLKRNMLWNVVEWSSVPNTLMQSCILKQTNLFTRLQIGFTMLMACGWNLSCHRLQSGLAGGYFCWFFVILKNAC